MWFALLGVRLAFNTQNLTNWIYNQVIIITHLLLTQLYQILIVFLSYSDIDTEFQVSTSDETVDYYDDFTLNFSNPLCSSTPNFLHSSFLRSSTPNFLSSNPLHDLISYQSFDLSYIVHNSSVSNVDDNSKISQENRFLTYVEDSVNHLTFSVSHSRLNKTNSRAYVDPCSPSPISTVSHSNVSQTNRSWNVSHRVLLNVSNSNDTSIQNPISTETRKSLYTSTLLLMWDLLT